jgi:hypothetical protein
MSLTFLSKSLGRTITFADIDHLKPAEARALLGELHVAVSSMTETMDAAENRVDSHPVDPDWLHGLSKKRRICSAFTAQVQPLVDALAPKATYRALYELYLEKLLAEELGSTYGLIKSEARDLALSDLQATPPDA